MSELSDRLRKDAERLLHEIEPYYFDREILNRILAWRAADAMLAQREQSS